MVKIKKNYAESVRQRLKNISEKINRPFDEILRYYAIERFLYRLSISPYKNNFCLKGGLMLKVWNHSDHRATMDIDFLARTSNEIENLRKIIVEVASFQIEKDAILFDTQKLLLRESQIGGIYHGIRASFFAKLFKSRIPILIDIGFNDIVVPRPQRIHYPTFFFKSELKLMGYTYETVVAEKLESIVKIGLRNTRMKDFYDLWIICKSNELNLEILKMAIQQVFNNRGTKIEYPIAFTKEFYGSIEILQRWKRFLFNINKEHIELKKVIFEISNFIKPLLTKLKNGAGRT